MELLGTVCLAAFYVDLPLRLEMGKEIYITHDYWAEIRINQGGFERAGQIRPILQNEFYFEQKWAIFKRLLLKYFLLPIENYF